MKVQTQIKIVLLTGIGIFFLLSGLWIIYIGLNQMIYFGGIYINFFDLYIGKTFIFYTVGISIGVALVSIINTYIRPALENVQ